MTAPSIRGIQRRSKEPIPLARGGVGLGNEQRAPIPATGSEWCSGGQGGWLTMSVCPRQRHLDFRQRVVEASMVECPVCDGEVELESDAVVGELMECPDCGTELEVLELDPPSLGEAPETEEDWGE